MTLTPPSLKTGDRIAIVAPAKQLPGGALEAALSWFSEWGLEVVNGEHIWEKEGFFAGNDEQRLEDLQSAIDDLEIKAVVCARGGHGTTRIVDKLDLEKLQKDPKWIVGYSDITTLHLRLANTGISSLHGLMPISFSKEAEDSIESLRKVLFGEDYAIRVPGGSLNRQGQATGTIIGGNLSLLAASIGTRSEPDTRGKILFIEDLGEKMYRIDRLLVHLDRAGKFQDLKALIVGRFTDIEEADEFGMGVNDCVLEHIRKYNFPISFNFPVSHDPAHNMAIIQNTEVILDISEEVILEFRR